MHHVVEEQEDRQDLRNAEGRFRRLRDGQIVEFYEYFDTALVASSMS